MSRRPRVLVLEFTTGAQGDGWYDRHVKLPNFLGVMPQAVSVWSQDAGSEVTYRTYTGNETPGELLTGDWDVAFLSAYTRTSYAAYAAAGALRGRGTVTVLGGPHALAYPADAQLHFDYVCGLTDGDVIARVLEERAPSGSAGGQFLSARRHPARLPSLQRRAPFLEIALAKARFLRIVPLLSSIGCPYACDFCSDARAEYQPLHLEDVEDDVRFALERYPDALLFWMDPTFGVRLDPLLDAIRRAAHGRRVRFGAETTLSLLSADRLAALAQAGCVALLPGIESWTGYDAKVGKAASHGAERVGRLAARFEEILSFIPYVQANFVLGLDAEPEPETFHLTAEFLRRAPGVWPSLNLVTAWGCQSPLSQRLHEEGRVLPVPLPMLDQKSCSNVVRRSGSHEDLYRGLLQIEEEAFGALASLHRAVSARRWGAAIVNVCRARGAEMRRRRSWHRRLIAALSSDRAVRAFFEGERVPIPELLRERALARIGPFARMLPPAIDEELRSGRWRAATRLPNDTQCVTSPVALRSVPDGSPPEVGAP